MSTRESRIAKVGFDPGAAEQAVVSECNLCGSVRTAEVSREDRYGYQTVLQVCTRCGLGFISPRMTSAEYGRFYESVYRPLVSAYHGRTIDAETVQIEQREYAEELVSFLAPLFDEPPRTLLDIGGSTGIVAGGVRDAFGSDATVLDPAPDELAVAATAGMETITGFAEDLDVTGRRWDLVLLCQTIDHLLDVRSTLDEIRGALTPGGRAFVDVLDVAFMARRRGSIEGAVKVDHPYYLTRDTARAYFALCGLEVVSERLAHDGHWGFLLAGGEPRELNLDQLALSADRLLGLIWELRAAG